VFERARPRNPKPYQPWPQVGVLPGWSMIFTAPGRWRAWITTGQVIVLPGLGVIAVIGLVAALRSHNPHPAQGVVVFLVAFALAFVVFVVGQMAKALPKAFGSDPYSSPETPPAGSRSRPHRLDKRRFAGNEGRPVV
jgi:hypothetical protein